jgi:hypothetical protein
MAIKKKTDKQSVELPAEFDSLVLKAFTEQFLSAKYDDLFKESKAEVLGYIEKSDDIEITEGEGFKTEYGSIILSSRSNYKYDKDKLAELVNDGTITVDQLLQCVSTFKAEELEKTLSTTVFNSVAEKSASQTFTFKATGDFKAKCEENFSESAPKPKAAPKKSAIAKEEKEIRKLEKEGLTTSDAQGVVEAKLLKAKAAAAKAKAKSAKSKSADDDLDAILGE